MMHAAFSHMFPCISKLTATTFLSVPLRKKLFLFQLFLLCSVPINDLVVSISNSKANIKYLLIPLIYFATDTIKVDIY